MYFIDTHCHWHDCHSVQQQQLHDPAIQYRIIPGVDQRSWLESPHHATGHYGAWGIHPLWINDATSQLASLEHALATTATLPIALGECGLDFRPHALAICDKTTQYTVAQAHCRLAKHYHLPLVLHSVQAHEVMLSLLKQCPPPAGGIIHGFAGSVEQARQYWRLGVHIGVGALIAQPRAVKTQRALLAMPLDALVLETDAPFPAWASHLTLRDIAQHLADQRQLSLADIATKTFYTGCHLFNLPPLIPPRQA